MSSIDEFKLEFIKERSDSLYICAAGFEDRSRAIVERLKDRRENFFKYSLILEYSDTKHKEYNKPNLEFIQSTLPQISCRLLENAIVDIDHIYQIKANIIEAFKRIPIEEYWNSFHRYIGNGQFPDITKCTSSQKKVFGQGDSNIICGSGHLLPLYRKKSRN